MKIVYTTCYANSTKGLEQMGLPGKPCVQVYMRKDGKYEVCARMLNGQPRVRVDSGEIPEYNLEELHLPSGVVEKGELEKAVASADKLLSLHINWHQPLKEKVWLH